MARRNALRVLGQFCWSSSGCRALHGQGCRMNRACAILLVGNEKDKFKAELQERILKETKDKPLDDALWISSTYFKPFVQLKRRYEAIAKDLKLPPVTRVRAVQSWNGLVSV